MKSWETLAICKQCGTEKVKRKDEIPEGGYCCLKCSRLIIGKMLGNKFGKSQVKKGKCVDCNLVVRSTNKRCVVCSKKFSKERNLGAKNPAWSGRNVCACGKKKSTGAKFCRTCSFKDGKRGGENNGRWEKDKGKKIAARVARTLLSNTLNTQGIKKCKKTVELLGYNFKAFRNHIESQFEPWMTWDNWGRGGWHIDHIIPVSVLINNGFRDPSTINALWNLRPLSEKLNIQKSNHIDDHVRELAKNKLNLILS